MSNLIQKSIYTPNPPKFTPEFFEPEEKQKKPTKYSVTFAPIIEKKMIAVEEPPLSLPPIIETETNSIEEPPITLPLDQEISETTAFSLKEEILTPSDTQKSLPSSQASLENLNDMLSISSAESLLPNTPEERYQNFMDLCVPLDQYRSSPFGLICLNHPEAQHPYPGPIPENPNDEDSFFSQFIKRKISKKFRAKEKAYRDEMRHWKIQMKNHLQEVPFLLAKDNLFRAYIALEEHHALEALEWSEKALNQHSLNPEALAIQVLAHYQLGNLEESANAKLKYALIQPKNILNSLAQNLFEELLQEGLKETYKNACKLAIDQLDHSEGEISFKRDYLPALVDNALNQISFPQISTQEIDFFNLTTQHLLKHVLKKSNSDGLNNEIAPCFHHLADLFEGLKENLLLIGALDKWDEFPATGLLKPDSEISYRKSKKWIEEVIEELSSPPSFGDAIFRRTFMENAIKIQTAKRLFKIAPELEAILNQPAPTSV